ncbi:hypothetical protein OC861_006661 [Tilletia horrida]|nr:hypothetical protein OC861_006661 [Tilletia horrida]
MAYVGLNYHPEMQTTGQNGDANSAPLQKRPIPSADAMSQMISSGIAAPSTLAVDMSGYQAPASHASSRNPMSMPPPGQQHHYGYSGPSYTSAQTIADPLTARTAAPAPGSAEVSHAPGTVSHTGADAVQACGPHAKSDTSLTISDASTSVAVTAQQPSAVQNVSTGNTALGSDTRNMPPSGATAPLVNSSIYSGGSGRGPAGTDSINNRRESDFSSMSSYQTFPGPGGWYSASTLRDGSFGEPLSAASNVGTASTQAQPENHVGYSTSNRQQKRRARRAEDKAQKKKYVGSMSRAMKTSSRKQPPKTKAWSCGYCGLSYVYEGGLRRHQINKHQARVDSADDAGKATTTSSASPSRSRKPLPRWTDVVPEWTSSLASLDSCHQGPWVLERASWPTILSKSLSIPQSSPPVPLPNLVRLCLDQVRAAESATAQFPRRTRPYAAKKNATSPNGDAVEKKLVARSVRLYPTSAQASMLHKILRVRNETYNRTIDLLNTGITDVKELRAKAVNDLYWKESGREAGLEVPYEIRDQAMLEARTAFQQAKTGDPTRQLARVNGQSECGSFRIRKRQWRKGFLHCPNLGLRLGQQEIRYTGFHRRGAWLQELLHDGATLVCADNKWRMAYTIDVDAVPEHDLSTDVKIIALDPGIRTFMTGFDVLRNRAIKFAPAHDQRMFRLMQRVDDIRSDIAKEKVYRRRRSLEVAANRQSVRIRHLVREVHRRTIHFLRDYDIILLPNFPVKDMTSRDGRRIRKKTVRSMFNWSFYRFRERLMTSNWGGKLVLVVEDYTSKTCSRCGDIFHKLGSSAVHNCGRCGQTADRDVNGAKNIFLHWVYDVLNPAVGMQEDGPRHFLKLFPKNKKPGSEQRQNENM